MTEATNFRLAYLLSLSKVESTIMLCVTAFLLSLGFMFGIHDTNPDYKLIWQFGSSNFWCITFGLYSVIKGLSLFQNIDYRLNILNSILGLWGWLYICLSFTVFDTSPISPHELVFMAPVLAESWLLLSYQHNKENIKYDNELN